MGRYFYCFLFCVSVLVSVENAFAQKKSDKDKKVNVERTLFLADAYFDAEQYNLAVPEYLKVANTDSSNVHSLMRLGECYKEFFEFEEAEKWYKKASKKNDSKYYIADYWYGVMQKMNGNYLGAEKTLEKFINEFKPADEQGRFVLDQAIFEYNGCVLAIEEFKKPQRDYHFENLGTPINTKTTDFAPALINHDSMIVITSFREGSTGEEIYAKTGETFSDNYRFEKIGDTWREVPNTDDFNLINSIKNDGAGVFSNDKKRYYYTKCFDLYDGGEKYELHPCKIYVTTLQDGKWAEPVLLNKNINPEGSENLQPALSKSEDTLFFVSNREGGFGTYDIWYSTAKGADRWGPATNLGPNINTPFIEASPSVHAESNSFFFSSDGHEGFGGKDVFRVMDKDFKRIKNLGLPFNSSRDDQYFLLGDKKGYMVSNRDGGQGHDDIYWFDIESHRSLIAIITNDSLNANSISIEGKVLYDDTREPATDVDILLANKDGITLKVTSTNDDGVFKFENLDAAMDYLLLLKEKDPKLTDKVQLLIDQLRLRASNMATSKKWFENIYFDFDKYDLRPEATAVLDELVALLKSNSSIQVEMNANTDSFGSDEYNDKLSENRGNAALNYLKSNGVDNTSIVINALGEGTPIATNENPIGRQLNRRVEFFIVGGTFETDAMTYIIEPKMTLFSIAQLFNMNVDELKKLNNLTDNSISAFRPIRVKRQNPTDIIAPQTVEVAKFNKYAYLNNTVDNYDPNNNKTDMKSADEPVLIGTVKGNKTSENSNDNETVNNEEVKEQVIDLRGENLHLKFNKVKPVDPSEVKEGEEIYVVQPLNTLHTISQEYGMTIQEIRDRNGLSSDRLQIGQQIIVRKK